jgi:DNA-binding transcriptional ArsR family regulator
MIETEIFKALADPTRRAVFEKLNAGAMNATELRAGMTISQPAMSQHLAVLRGAGLVTEERAGRAIRYSVAPDGLKPLREWMTKYSRFWPERIGDLKTLLKEMDE